MYVEIVEEQFQHIEPHQRQRAAIHDVYREDLDIFMEALAAKIPYHVAEKDPR
jgi:hypothetical protein